MHMEEEKHPRVLSLGAVAMDVVLDSTALPQDDGFAVVRSERLTPGGSASNTSVALQRMGVQAYQAGKIGDDNYGRLFREDLIRSGVNVDSLVIRSGGTTLHTYIVTAPEGRHCIFANRGDCVFALKPEELPQDVLNGISCFYTDLFSADAALYLGEKASRLHIPVVYNLQCVPSFMESCGVGREKLETMLRLSTLALGGADGFGELCGGPADPRHAAQAVYERYRPADGVICTCGSAGAVWCGPEGLIEGPAYSVPVADTTGAGDVFSAGVIFRRYCMGEGDRREVLRFASAAAALKCTVPGPRSTAGRAEIESFLKNCEEGNEHGV